MKVFVVIIVFLIKTCTSTEFCPLNDRCMDESRLNCNNSLLAPSDFHCCTGLQCVSALIPATDTQEQFNTTICVSSSSSSSSSSSTYVSPSKVPPIMASSWSSATTYYNMSNGDTGWGYFWYDASHQAIRTDFYPMCPFLQLYELGVDANYIPCTVIFYEGQNYYIYPTVGICCNYTFPAWQPDWMCQSNATFNGTTVINGKLADFWMIEWFSNFTGEGPVRNIRSMYTEVDSHIPIRFREDLDTGYLDFHDYYQGPIDSNIFTSMINQFVPCHQGHEHDGTTDKTCTRYNSQTLRRSWPCDNPTCSKVMSYF